MTLLEKLDSLWQSVGSSEHEAAEWMERIRSEISVAQRYVEAHPEKEWDGLVEKALGEFDSALSSGENLKEAVKKAEDILKPIGKELKTYTFHCCGHAHIDMNWLWPWQETVHTTRDSFSTVDLLMDSFPEFKFSQDQASTYVAMEEYSPEVFEMIKRRVKEGRWDVTASTWVEGEKNLSSGEALCRQMLYTRRYFKEKFGLEYDDIKIDWEPDMFGHSRMLPSILNRGGVTRYYFCRAGKEPKLFWWQAPDGSRVLAYLDNEMWYNGAIGPHMDRIMFRLEKETSGLKDYLFMYGIGDHGGGPTRRDLIKLGKMQQWPVYPTLKQAKVEDFYAAAEKSNLDLPVIDDELNFVFEGCYTSQASVKRGNRISENELVKAEGVALIAGAVAGMPYPADDLKRGWRHTMLCQFHDILPGSGVRDTYQYSNGLYQEVAAITESVVTRGLRQLASKVNTAAVVGDAPDIDGKGANLGDGAGAGAGDPSMPGGVTGYNVGSSGAQPFILYNPLPWKRSEVVTAKIWNTNWQHDKISVMDDSGNTFPAQVIGTGNYWGHDFITVAFPAGDIPATGYRIFGINRSVLPQKSEGVKVHAAPQIMHCPSAELPVVGLENEHLRVDIESASGSIVHLIDKSTGQDLVPEGERMGILEYCQEAPNGMSAWVIGQIKQVVPFMDDGTLDVTQRGPHRAAVVYRRTYKDSSFTLEISLAQGSRQVEFALDVNWLERGSHETGIPQLRVSFPVAVEAPEANYEVPFGHIQRDPAGHEVPALKWADLSGKTASGKAGITLINADKYGHCADGNVLRLTLLRSSYAPDPLPDLGAHRIRWAVAPHSGEVNVSQAMRAGWEFNAPITVASTDAHKGDLPTTHGFISVEQENIMLASVKKAEDSDGLILRLFEMEGKDTQAKVKIDTLVPADAKVNECDILERLLSDCSASFADGVLTVKVPAYGIATVKVW